jgi:hypothetical protein
LSVGLLFPALSRDGALWQSLAFSADGARMSTFVEGGLSVFPALAPGKGRAPQRDG